MGPLEQADPRQAGGYAPLQRENCVTELRIGTYALAYSRKGDTTYNVAGGSAGS